jgi:hypothetical protein
MTPQRLPLPPDWSADRLAAALRSGGRLVFYEICISALVFTLRRPTALVYLPPGRPGWLFGLPYSLLTLLLGWWGLPWGFIYTPLALYTNFSGGCDVTDQVLARLSPPSEKSSHPCES